MNHSESLKILEEVKKAKSVLLMCHKSPDLDSIISCLLMSKILSQLGIKSEIYSIDEIPKHFKIVDQNKIIHDRFDITKIDLAKFDLFIALDINQLLRFGFENNFQMTLPIINIDHHAKSSNTINSVASILNEDLSSTSEVVYFLAKDWGTKLQKDDLQMILVSIINDTDTFGYSASAGVFRTVATLIEDGANYDKADVFLNRRNPLDQVHYWAEMMSSIQVDINGKFAYTSMNYKEFSKYNDILQPTRTVADMFIRTIDGTNFGIVMVENKKGELNISIRSRDVDYRVLELLESLGGGGHVNGGGASIKGMKYDDALNFVLEKAREFSKNK